MRPLQRPANYRDVGEALSLWLDPPPIAVGRLLRGGRFDTLTTSEELGSPQTVLNLRRGADPVHLEVEVVHVPAPDDLENYSTSNRRVSEWVKKALRVLASESTRWPVYVHCTSGRDRTGVIVAAVLAAMGVPAETIVEEYALSSGADRALIQLALEGLVVQRLDPRELDRLRRALT